MRVKELIERLSAIDPEKTIHIIVNLENPEDDDFDEFCQTLECWDSGEESIDLFVGR